MEDQTATLNIQLELYELVYQNKNKQTASNLTELELFC